MNYEFIRDCNNSFLRNNYIGKGIYDMKRSMTLIAIGVKNHRSKVISINPSAIQQSIITKKGE